MRTPPDYFNHMKSEARNEWKRCLSTGQRKRADLIETAIKWLDGKADDAGFDAGFKIETLRLGKMWGHQLLARDEVLVRIARPDDEETGGDGRGWDSG